MVLVSILISLLCVTVSVFLLRKRGKGDILFHQVVQWGLEDQEDPKETKINNKR